MKCSNKIIFWDHWGVLTMNQTMIPKTLFNTITVDQILRLAEESKASVDSTRSFETTPEQFRVYNSRSEQGMEGFATSDLTKRSGRESSVKIE